MTSILPTAFPSGPSARRMSYEQFLETAFPEGARAEWVNSEVEMMAAVTDEHEWTRKLLWRLFDFYSPELKRGEVFSFVRLGASAAD